MPLLAVSKGNPPWYHTSIAHLQRSKPNNFISMAELSARNQLPAVVSSIKSDSVMSEASEM